MGFAFGVAGAFLRLSETFVRKHENSNHELNYCPICDEKSEEIPFLRFKLYTSYAETRLTRVYRNYLEHAPYPEIEKIPFFDLILNFRPFLDEICLKYLKALFCLYQTSCGRQKK